MIKKALITIILCVGLSLITHASAHAGASANEAILRITEDVNKAKEIAKAFKMPIALVFVGSDWCSFSKKLLTEVLCKEDFAKGLKKKVLFVKVDFPELHQHLDKDLLEQHFNLKKKFHVEEFPTLVLVDDNLNEISRFGYEAQTAADYGTKLLSCVSTYERVKQDVDEMQKPFFGTLKKLYVEASNLGSESLKDAIVEKGLIVDREAFFHLEKYAKTPESSRNSLKKKILSNYKENQDYIKLRLALLDFQERNNQEMDGQIAIEPLIKYAESVGFKEKDQSFRVHMLIANHLAKEGDTKEALKHAKLSLIDAPEKHKSEIQKSINLYTAELIAHRDL